MWSNIPGTVATIRQRVPEPYASQILGLNLQLNDGDSCYPSGDTIICARRLSTPEVMTHEYGHWRGFQYGPGYPHGWRWSFRDIAGYEYVGKGNNMTSEGYAEAVSRALMNNQIVNHDAHNFIQQELSLTVAGNPESFNPWPWVFMALVAYGVSRKGR